MTAMDSAQLLKMQLPTIPNGTPGVLNSENLPVSKIFVNPGVGPSVTGGVALPALSGQPKQQIIDKGDQQLTAAKVKEAEVPTKSKDEAGKGDFNRSVTSSAKNEMSVSAGKNVKVNASKNSSEDKFKKSVSKGDSVSDKKGATSVAKNDDKVNKSDVKKAVQDIKESDAKIERGYQKRVQSLEDKMAQQLAQQNKVFDSVLQVVKESAKSLDEKTKEDGVLISQQKDILKKQEEFIQQNENLIQRQEKIVKTNEDILHKHGQTFQKILSVEKRMTDLQEQQTKLNNTTALLWKDWTKIHQGMMQQISTMQEDAQKMRQQISSIEDEAKKGLKFLSDKIKLPGTAGTSAAAGSQKETEGKHYNPVLDDNSDNSCDSEDGDDDEVQEVDRVTKEPPKSVTDYETYDPSTRPEYE